MENVKSIEHAVSFLSPIKLAEFYGASWDRKIEQDKSADNLDQLAVEALADVEHRLQIERSRLIIRLWPT